MQRIMMREADEIRPRKEYMEKNEREDHELLKQLYGKYKKFPRGYELQTLIALSHYPELKDIPIEFVFEKCHPPLASQPAKSSIFLPAKKRMYVVKISKEAEASIEPVLLRNLTFNQQVGAIGHELGHITDYISKTSIELIGIGIGYFIPHFKTRLESKTDLIAIRHGLGYQILDYAELIAKLKKKYPENKYYRTYYNYYLTPGEIKEKMRQLKMYE
jgi:hypothetical protein